MNATTCPNATVEMIDLTLSVLATGRPTAPGMCQLGVTVYRTTIVLTYCELRTANDLGYKSEVIGDRRSLGLVECDRVPDAWELPMILRGAREYLTAAAV